MSVFAESIVTVLKGNRSFLDVRVTNISKSVQNWAVAVIVENRLNYLINAVHSI